MRERLQRLNAATSRAFGEVTRWEPIKSGGAMAGAPDTTRPVRDDLRGEYASASKSIRPSSLGGKSGEVSEQRGSYHFISYALDAFPDDLRPQSGDIIVLRDRPGQPRFRITPGGPMTPGRLTYPLTPAGAAS